MVAGALAIVVGVLGTILSSSGKSENVEDSRKFLLLAAGGMVCWGSASIVKAKYRD